MIHPPRLPRFALPAALLLAIASFGINGCASQKETVNYGPLPPMMDVMNFLDYLDERLDLDDTQRQQVFNVLQATVPDRREMRRAGMSRPPMSGPGGPGGGMHSGAMREEMRERMDRMRHMMRNILTGPQYREFKRILKEVRDRQQDQRQRPRGGMRGPGGMGGRPGGGF